MGGAHIPKMSGIHQISAAGFGKTSYYFCFTLGSEIVLERLSTLKSIFTFFVFLNSIQKLS